MISSGFFAEWRATFWPFHLVRFRAANSMPPVQRTAPCGRGSVWNRCGMCGAGAFPSRDRRERFLPHLVFPREYVSAAAWIFYVAAIGVSFDCFFDLESGRLQVI